jgi:hypothetical protein
MSMHGTATRRGEILVGGSFSKIGDQIRNRIARLNSDGSLDMSFNPEASGGVHTLALQPDGKVLVGGGFLNDWRTNPPAHRPPVPQR